MVESKPVNISLAIHILLSAAQCSADVVEKILMSSISYESAMSSLMYLIVCTRPDITFVVNKMYR